MLELPVCRAGRCNCIGSSCLCGQVGGVPARVVWGCVGLLPLRGSLGAVSLRVDLSNSSAGFTPGCRDVLGSPCCAVAAVCLPAASPQWERVGGKAQKSTIWG